MTVHLHRKQGEYKNIVKYSKILIFLGIGCVAGLLLVFGVHLQAQNATKKEIITAKANEMKISVTPQMEQFRTRQQNLAAQGRQQRSDSSKSDNSADFYRAIVDNNIFRPLGWRPPNKEPEYAYIGTRIDPTGTFSQAYVLEQRSNQFYIAKVGDKVGDAIVKEIEEKKVTLDKNGETITLRNENTPFLNSSGSRRSSSSRSESSNQNVSNNNKESASKSSNKAREAAEKEKAEAMRKLQEMRQRFERSSRGDRERMIREFRERGGFRGRRGSR